MSTMPKFFAGALPIAFVLCCTVMGCAAQEQQSLGDIARELKAKQNADSSASASSSSTAPKIITNKDLPHDGDGVTPSPQPPAPVEKGKGAAQFEAKQRQADQHATQWRRQILAQKERMANLQSRINVLNASIRAENGSAQFSGPNGRGQARQVQQVVNLQQQLDVQRIRLDQMQESARRAGMQAAVYDP
jgi:hypothetical protein